MATVSHDVSYLTRVRRRGVNTVRGWLFPGIDTQSLEVPTSIQTLVFTIIALNVRTLKALRDGYSDCETQITDNCHEDYRKTLAEGEVELLKSLTQKGGSEFDLRVSEYVTTLSRDAAFEYIEDPRPGQLYGQLINTCLKKYRTTQIHAAFAQRLPSNFKVPKHFEYPQTHLGFIEYAILKAHDDKQALGDAMETARRFIQSGKAAEHDGYLQKKHLATLGMKASALQKYYAEAHELLYGQPRNLLGPEEMSWLNVHTVADLKLHGYALPHNVVNAYDRAGTRRPLLSFVVPIVCIASCIPIGIAWTRSDVHRGSYQDSNFHQLLSGSILQLLSLATMVHPTIFDPRLARVPWLLTWVLGTVSALCTLTSIGLYLLVPPGWSMLLAFAGMLSQVLIILQIMHKV